MSEIMKFKFENNEKLECVELDGEPLFNPFTVGKCLEMSDNTVKKYVSQMDIEDRVDLKSLPEKTLIYLKEMNKSPRYLLRESGMYLFVFKSRKPEAKEFKKWVAREVLPQIRRTGSYETEHSMNRLLRRFVNGIQQLTGVKGEEIAITQNESWNKRLSNLMVDCSRNGMGSMKELYDELFYIFSSECGFDIPELAEGKGLTRMQYLKRNPAIAKTLYEFAHKHFTRENRQVILVPLDKDQKSLDRFVGGK